jgi:hypothetical protein
LLRISSPLSAFAEDEQLDWVRERGELAGVGEEQEARHMRSAAEPEIRKAFSAKEAH